MRHCALKAGHSLFAKNKFNLESADAVTKGPRDAHNALPQLIFNRGKHQIRCQNQCNPQCYQKALNLDCVFACLVCSVSFPLSQNPFSSWTSCGIRLHRSLLSSSFILFVYLSHVLHTKSIFQLMTSASIIFLFQHPKHLKCWPQKCCCCLVSIFSFDRNIYTGLCVIWVLKFTKLLQFLNDMPNTGTHNIFSLFELLLRSEKANWQHEPNYAIHLCKG